MVKKFDIAGAGFESDGRIMDNGERRIRLKADSDGSAYIRTDMDSEEKGGWQNAHAHKGMRETYIVQKGWIGYAESRKTTYEVHVCREGDVFTTSVGIDHNVYMPAGAVIHTVQHGTPVGNPDKKGNDWYDAHPAFDRWTKSLPEAIFLNASESGPKTE